ncbi:MAG TPA: GNAT family N-acetyltransferase [Caulobacteraceae bacterium]|nr:GNAT family N-acetyltransferase [Caulobacteraceae bacterium]
MTIAVRPATAADVGLIHGFVVALAVYEKLDHTVEATPADFEHLLFADPAAAFSEIVEIDGEPVGFSLSFYSVSTFTGRKGVWLEDLFVREDARGKGAGLALLKSLAARCMHEGLPRLEWSVLDWNAPSIAFYDAIGSDAIGDWTVRRLTGEALAKLGQASP